MLVRFLVLELLFQALSRYSKILVYTCIITIFCSRTVILQLLVVQVVWFLLQFLCLRCIARSAYVPIFVFVGSSQGNIPVKNIPHNKGDVTTYPKLSNVLKNFLQDFGVEKKFPIFRTDNFGNTISSSTGKKGMLNSLQAIKCRVGSFL